MQRRDALKLIVGMAALPWWPRLAAADELPHTVIGFSQGGLPLVIHHLGLGPTRVLVLGGQHGGPEANTIELAAGLLDYFVDHPGDLPSGLGLDVLKVANPDGVQVGSRQFLSGVDPNRNWASADWQSDAWDSNGRLREGLGGSVPFSEQETRALRDWVLVQRPALIVNYHSAGGFMFAGQPVRGVEVGEVYAEASGYYRPTASSGSGGPRLLSYRATGSMGGWQREQGLPGLFIELTTPYSPEFSRNLAGLRAVLASLASVSA
jgi:hypothetical protein